MSIHIKPENKGKFTAYKKRTGKTTEEALHSSNPHVRQMANFAKNAKKWHHEYGGYLMALGGALVNSGVLSMPGELQQYAFGGTGTAIHPVSKTYEKGGWFKPNPNDTGVMEHENGGQLGGFYPKQRSVYQSNLIPMAQMGLDLNNFRRLYGNDQQVGTSIPIQQGPMSIPKQGNSLSNIGKGAGIVGSIIGMADQIAAPIKASADSVNPDGSLVSERRSAMGAQAGLAFDPLRTSIKTFTDKNASGAEKWGAIGGILGLPGLAGQFGKARANRINKQGLEETQKLISNQANANFTQMMNSQYEQGGQMDVYPYSKNIVEYKGATHGEGGIKVDSNGNPTAKTGRPAVAETEDKEINWNNYIFSNKLVYGKKK
jgi:hypothetical protein